MHRFVKSNGRISYKLGRYIYNIRYAPHIITCEGVYRPKISKANLNMRKTYSTSKHLHRSNRVKEKWLRDQLTLEKESSPLLLESGLDSALQRYNTGCGESPPVNQCTLNSHYWSDWGNFRNEMTAVATSSDPPCVSLSQTLL